MNSRDFELGEKSVFRDLRQRGAQEAVAPEDAFHSVWEFTSERMECILWYNGFLRHVVRKVPKIILKRGTET